MPSRNTSVRVVAFKIHTLNLGVPMPSVARVLYEVPVYGTGQNGIGITHLGEKELTIIDLKQQLFGSSYLNSTASERPLVGSHVIVAQNQAREQCGLLLDTAPTLIDVPPNSIRVLPDSYRRAELGFCNYVAVVPETALTMFLLDINCLIGTPQL